MSNRTVVEETVVTEGLVTVETGERKDSRGKHYRRARQETAVREERLETEVTEETKVTEDSQ